MDKTEKQFVEFAASLKFSDLSPAAIHAAKARFVDSFGVALAAQQAPTVKAARKLAASVRSGPRARILGSLETVTPDMAAFVNGAMVRYLDMNDAYTRASTSHPSDNIPALLAVAEATGASGRDLILATIICYEIHCRVCQDVSFFFEGWDQSLGASPALALAVARLLRLKPNRMRDALAIAATESPSTRQTRTGELSMWKGLAGPSAARQGVFAAYAAKAGATGPRDSYEGNHGIWNLIMGKSQTIPIPKSFKRHTFAIQQTNIKVFPIRDGIQVPVTTAMKLRQLCNPKEIKSLRIESYRHAFERWAPEPAFWKPTTRETADHSLPFCLAAALLDGEITPQTFLRKRFMDRDIRAYMKKMSLHYDKAFDKVAPGTRNCRLTATLKNGSTVTAVHTQTSKDMIRGLSDSEIEAKFHKLNHRVYPEKVRNKLISRLWDLDKVKDIGKIVALTKSK
ncbi:MAG: MmgE/PrpD family protein [Rhodospirillales bacterium]|jgi:2-methylcitrate dehydratase